MILGMLIGVAEMSICINLSATGVGIVVGRPVLGGTPFLVSIAHIVANEFFQQETNQKAQNISFFKKMMVTL